MFPIYTYPIPDASRSSNEKNVVSFFQSVSRPYFYRVKQSLMENLLKALKDLNIEKKKESLMESIGSISAQLEAIKNGNTFDDLDQDEAQATFDYLSDLLNIVRDISVDRLTNHLIGMRHRASGQIAQIAAQGTIEKCAERGYTIGSLHYIDRQDGIYMVESIDSRQVRFKYCMPNSNPYWAKTKNFDADKLDNRMQPLRTTGPFKVGTIVMRDEIEYTVRGYLGYRMVIEVVQEMKYWTSLKHLKSYTIVSKKDESTYKSIII